MAKELEVGKDFEAGPDIEDDGGFDEAVLDEMSNFDPTVGVGGVTDVPADETPGEPILVAEADVPPVVETPVEEPVSTEADPEPEAAPEAELVIAEDAPPILEADLTIEGSLADEEPPGEVVNIVTAEMLAAAQDKLAARKAAIAQPKQPVDTTPQPVPITVAPQAPMSIPVQEASVGDIVNQGDFEQFFSGPEHINKALVESQARGQQSTIATILPLVGQIVQQGITLALARRDFYNVNDDLVPYQALLGTAGEVLAAEHPDWDVLTLFNAAEKEVRESLGLSKSVETIATDAPKPARTQKPAGTRPSRKPATAPRGARRTPAAESVASGDMTEADMDELLGMQK